MGDAVVVDDVLEGSDVGASTRDVDDARWKRDDDDDAEEGRVSGGVVGGRLVESRGNERVK